MSFTQTTVNTPAANSVGVTELNLSDGTNGQVLTTNGSGTISFANGGVAGIVSSADATAITIDSSENVTFTGSGTFGSNVTALTSFNSTTGNDLRLNAGSVNRDIFMQVNGSTLMTIQGSTGNVGIGTSSPISNAALTLENSANSKLVFRMSTASAGEYWRQEVDSSNDLYIIDNNSTGVYITDGSTSWSGISDENLKENIVELTDVLDKIRDFRCVEYNLIADEADSKKIGFIAQDWQEDYSQVVSQDNDGNLGMKYTETIPVLLKAIQEQQALIEAQATTITDLTTRIETLENA